MKLWHWLVVAAAIYEGAVGLSELLSTSGTNPLSAFAGLPSVGSIVQQSATGATNTTAGVVDLATAGLLFVFPLHKKLLTA